MKKLLLITFLVSFTSFVCAQGAPQQAADKPVAPSKTKEEKSKPIILDKVKLLELDNLQLKLQNAQLLAERAIPVELKASRDNADKAIADFWAILGIKREELQTKWQVSNGQNGDIILTRVEEVPPAPAKLKP